MKSQVKTPPNYLFDNEYPALVCRACKTVIMYGFGSWTLSESRTPKPHKCETQVDWAAAAGEMKKLRKESRPMTFEEEAMAYNTIIKNQTFLDEI